MSCSGSRLARQVGIWFKCRSLASPHPLLHGAIGTSANLFGDQRARAAYSSLTRENGEERSVIITGSSQGIGKAIALRLATDGYNVCINDLPANEAKCDEIVREIRNIGRKACTAIADVTKRDEVKEMVQKSVRELGPLNTLIANAGIVRVANVLEVSDEDFRRVLEVNIVGAHNSLAEGARQLRDQGTCRADRPGKLLAASSIVGFRSYPALPSYSTSKWAIRGLIQAYAMELAPHHITANAYAPGIVGTTMWDTIDEGVVAMTGMEKGIIKGQLVKQMTALGRESVPEDVAKLISFMASRDSDFITGQTQLVDGGIIFT